MIISEIPALVDNAVYIRKNFSHVEIICNDRTQINKIENFIHIYTNGSLSLSNYVKRKIKKAEDGGVYLSIVFYRNSSRISSSTEMQYVPRRTNYQTRLVYFLKK